MASIAKSMDIDVREISPQEAQKMAPNISTERLEGALWCPVDGVADTHALCNILAAEAEKNGTKIIEGLFIDRILRDDRNNKVTGIECNFGETLGLDLVRRSMSHTSTLGVAVCCRMTSLTLVRSLVRPFVRFSVRSSVRCG